MQALQYILIVVIQTMLVLYLMPNAGYRSLLNIYPLILSFPESCKL